MQVADAVVPTCVAGHEIFESLGSAAHLIAGGSDNKRRKMSMESKEVFSSWGLTCAVVGSDIRPVAGGVACALARSGIPRIASHGCGGSSKG